MSDRKGMCASVIIGKRKAITSGNWSFNSHHNELMRTLKGLKRWKMQLTKFWTQITERMWCEFVSCSFSWIKQTKMAQIESVNIISQHEILGLPHFTSRKKFLGVKWRRLIMSMRLWSPVLVYFCWAKLTCIPLVKPPLIANYIFLLLLQKHPFFK